MQQGLAIELDQVMPSAFATGLFVSSASFLAPSETQGSTGNSIGGPSPIQGLQDIPAMNAPRAAGLIGMSSDEKLEFSHVEAKRLRHMLLQGYFPQLDTGFAEGAGAGLQVQVLDPSGITTLYRFLGGEGDSQQKMTRVQMQLVAV
jgi:hypothetical protein